MSSDMSKCLATLGATLQDSIGKRVLVKLRDGYEIRGILKSFDQHVNLLLKTPRRYRQQYSAEEGHRGR
jgi:Small nuclear ribonucleoprotein, LSM family